LSGLDTSCEVLVVGAGVSGTSAALAAARSGASTILIEKDNFLGGIGYSGLFQYICGLYLNGDSFPHETLNRGLVREIVDFLNKLSPQNKIKKIGQVYVLPYNRKDLQYIFNSLCTGEKNLTVRYNTTAVSVENQNGKITKVSVRDNTTMYEILPEIVIDCTGSGIVSVMAGASFELTDPEKIQMAGYVVRFKGLKEVDETLSIKVPYYLSEAVDKTMLPEYLRFSSFSPGESPDEGYCKINIVNPDINEREQEVKKDIILLHRYLMDNLRSFKDSYIAETSLRVMDREGRRICGDYMLTEEDVLGARKFHDGVVKNSWPIEIWDRNKGVIYKYLKAGEYYEIPFRCLKVKEMVNLLCAGRCISVTHEALGSTRVMGTCMSLGEQAGLAAAYYAKNKKYAYLI
jgi:hypothetical protein